jgi:hypothetical protein
MEELLNNNIVLGFIVMTTQIACITLRTVNMKHLLDGKIMSSMISGNLLALTFLISSAIGIKAVLSLDLIPVLGHLIGGSIGMYWGIIKNRNQSKHLNK